MSAARQLHAVAAASAVGPRAVFCSHCGKPPETAALPEVGSRVCSRCNLGLLEAAPALAPKANDPFLIVDRSLAVCALARRAERLFGLREVDAVDRHMTELLVPADAEAQGPHALSAPLVAAASGGPGDEVSEAVLRPADEFGVRFGARIGPCGPTPGALLVLD